MSDLLSLPQAGRYGCILADPPWSFKTWSEKRQTRAAKNHYGVMDLDAIKALPVAKIAAPDAVLLLWAINPMLPQALEVMSAWGFKFKTVAFTWAKRTPTDTAWHFGLGYWTRQNTEQVLLGVRGKPKAVSRGVPQLLVAPRREHSRKPDVVRERAEQLLAGPRLEMFARSAKLGWDVFGDQTDKFSPEG